MGTHKGNSWSWPWGHTGEERPSKQGLLQGSQGPTACPDSISTLTLSLAIYSPGKWLLGVEKAKMQVLPGRGARPGGGVGGRPRQHLATSQLALSMQTAGDDCTHQDQPHRVLEVPPPSQP